MVPSRRIHNAAQEQNAAATVVTDNVHERVIGAERGRWRERIPLHHHCRGRCSFGAGLIDVDERLMHYITDPQSKTVHLRERAKKRQNRSFGTPSGRVQPSVRSGSPEPPFRVAIVTTRVPPVEGRAAAALPVGWPFQKGSFFETTAVTFSRLAACVPIVFWFLQASLAMSAIYFLVDSRGDQDAAELLPSPFVSVR